MAVRIGARGGAALPGEFAGTEAFPLRHSFVDAGLDGDPYRDRIRVAMQDFVDFLGMAPGLQRCSLRAPRTFPNKVLQPLSSSPFTCWDPAPFLGPQNCFRGPNVDPQFLGP